MPIHLIAAISKAYYQTFLLCSRFRTLQRCRWSVSLMDTVVASYAENLPQIYALFAKTLQDPESLEVRVTTVQALGRVAEYIEVDEEASIASFQAMIPQMLVVIGLTL
ncbi:importin [Puccinia graminis f. sp. tritici]|uniref:Importin n=1 Tax=Puccinia graminis f. sp. tritici TaxID=56615 RepID=A0A5B0R126_PUCGR|nr:importin [Puccinia graminis f. sp. tritici]